MSDTGRKGVAEQAQEKITPDSQKSTTQKASENITGVGDKIAGSVQPQDQKSYTQQASDATRSNADAGQNQGQSILQQGQEMVGNAAQTVADTLSGNQKK